MCTGPLVVSADLVLSSSSMICRVLLLSVSDDVFITDSSSSSSSSCVLVVNCWRQSCSDFTYRQTDRQTDTLSHPLCDNPYIHAALYNVGSGSLLAWASGATVIANNWTCGAIHPPPPLSAALCLHPVAHRLLFINRPCRDGMLSWC